MLFDACFIGHGFFCVFVCFGAVFYLCVVLLFLVFFCVAVLCSFFLFSAFFYFYIVMIFLKPMSVIVAHCSRFVLSCLWTSVIFYILSSYDSSLWLLAFYLTCFLTVCHFVLFPFLFLFHIVLWVIFVYSCHRRPPTLLFVPSTTHFLSSVSYRLSSI